MVHQLIYQLESHLLLAGTRNSSQKLDELLADDFVEFGSSGLIYQKNDIINFLAQEAPRNFVVSNFVTKKLSPQIVLATYTLTEGTKVSLRSSLWKKIANHWQLSFHQGTLVSTQKAS